MSNCLAGQCGPSFWQPWGVPALTVLTTKVGLSKSGFTKLESLRGLFLDLEELTRRLNRLWHLYVYRLYKPGSQDHQTSQEIVWSYLVSGMFVWAMASSSPWHSPLPCFHCFATRNGGSQWRKWAFLSCGLFEKAHLLEMFEAIFWHHFKWHLGALFASSLASIGS